MLKNKKIIKLVLFCTFFSLLPTYQADASVSTNPTFELDPSNVNSFNPSSTGTVYDLVSNRSISGTNSWVSFSNINGGIFDTFSATSKTGFYFAPAAVGTGTNPSGSITAETWIKFSSFNVTWNIFATRWFIDTTGTGTPSDFHFAVKSNGTNYKLNLFTTSTSDLFGSQTIVTNKWYLLAFTINNSTQQQKF